MNNQFITTNQLILIIVSLLAGVTARLMTLKEDFRQYPTYPNGYLIHIVTAIVASSLGSVAIPSLFTRNFVAVTWLSIGLQQFRDIRKVEKESLSALENTEALPRGSAYIDGIAKTFEARNYTAFIVSLVTAITIQILDSANVFIRISVAAVVAAISIFLLKRFSKGKNIGDIATIKEGKIEVKDSELFVDGIFVSNLLGTDNAQKLFESEGIAVVIYPNAEHFRITLDNFGQRQAILFEATKSLGLKRYAFTRKDYSEGRIVIAFVPVLRDINKLIKVVQLTPLLESIKKSHSLMKTNIKEDK